MFGRTIPALSLAALASAAAAQSAAPAPGALVRDAQGEVLGRIETIVTDAQGRPVQAVVRSRGVPGVVGGQARALPVSSLRPNGDGFTAPLRRAEFQLLPASKR